MGRPAAVGVPGRSQGAREAASSSDRHGQRHPRHTGSGISDRGQQGTPGLRAHCAPLSSCRCESSVPSSPSSHEPSLCSWSLPETMCTSSCPLREARPRTEEASQRLSGAQIPP